MKQEIWNPWVVGVTTTLVAFLALNLLFNLDPTCWDGWVSSSIGSQGACSHHGGVNKTLGTLAWLISVGAGIAVGLRQNKKNSYKSSSNQANSIREPAPKSPENSTITKQISPKPNIQKSLYAPQGIPGCPLHGRMMESIDENYWVCPESSGCDYYLKKALAEI
ncbi:hypothetical protein [Profundibacter sp.]